jgi:hypothetical protein
MQMTSITKGNEVRTTVAGRQQTVLDCVEQLFIDYPSETYETTVEDVFRKADGSMRATVWRKKGIA